uniref:Secreted protein n=1 Tax=Arundo donax TaxID=35708 RepID=A0A0A9A4F7_ARUDO
MINYCYSAFISIMSLHYFIVLDCTALHSCQVVSEPVPIIYAIEVELVAEGATEETVAADLDPAATNLA